MTNQSRWLPKKESFPWPVTRWIAARHGYSEHGALRWFASTSDWDHLWRRWRPKYEEITSHRYSRSVRQCKSLQRLADNAKPQARSDLSTVPARQAKHSLAPLLLLSAYFHMHRALAREMSFLSSLTHWVRTTAVGMDTYQFLIVHKLFTTKNIVPDQDSHSWSILSNNIHNTFDMTRKNGNTFGMITAAKDGHSYLIYRSGMSTQTSRHCGCELVRITSSQPIWMILLFGCISMVCCRRAREERWVLRCDRSERLPSKRR